VSEKKAFLDAWDRESGTTMKVLRAYPGAKEGLKPHDSCRSAKDLAWTFVFEGIAGAQAVQGEMKYPPPNMPAMPANWQGVVGEDEKALKSFGAKGGKAGELQVPTTVQFKNGPKPI